MNIFIHTLLLYLVLEFQSKKVSAKLTKADSNEHSPKEDLDDDVPFYHSRVLENNRDLEREDTSGGNATDYDDYSVYACDIYRDAWKQDVENKWEVGRNIKNPLFCTGNPFWQSKPFQPTCNKDWPIRIEFYDGSKFENGTLKVCFVNMADSKNSSNTRNCLNKVVNGFDSSGNGTSRKVDWIVYLTAGYNARILWYHDFSETLIKRFQQPDRRIVVAMIYWEEMANNVYEQEWYEMQIKLAINGGELSIRNEVTSDNDELPHRQSGAMRTTACLTSSYKQASLNAMVVGNVVGELVKHIKNEHASDTEYTTICIGLSIGAHTCGFIGKSSKMVDKILAIDPAGPIFDHHPPEFRLNKGDASVVHALHTSSGYSGMEDAIADVDFYPNGLWDNQPLDCPNSASFQCGCPKEWTITPGFYNNIDCSHTWGIEFLIRTWEQTSDSWYCNSTVYCTSMSGYFPIINDDISQQKDGYNKCFEGDVVEVGNLEKMEKNENGIRWFETQSSENCRFTNTVRELSKWTEDFKTSVKMDDYFEEQ